MIAVKLLPLLQVLVILCSPSHSYPTAYGAKSQTYPEEYYYEPMSYPVYYPRTSKYEVYQAVLPYYYDRPLMRTGFGYYGYEDADPIVDIEEEMIHDAERKQREDAQPIGQETYFEDDANSSTDENYYNDVNAAFLNNLIMSQMYKDSLDSDDDVYGKVDEYPPKSKSTYFDSGDEDELELKSLVENKQKQVKPDDRWSWFQKGSNKKSNEFFDSDFNEKKRSVDGHLQWFTDRDDRKPTVKPTITPSTTTTVTNGFTSKKTQRGQKEVVLPRPAAPVKHLFAPVVNDVYKKDRPRQPSVYDTIKHMLDMEKSLEKADSVAVKPVMRKRIISSEDSLTRQLSVLKKHE
ncbi:uncharacterized protein [Atheta coriaria]|uniref:uncharacterized protein isoform X2 n=1 Tax=Dalotia coriaria TaxID=877792 RepID=UPI0031F41FA5